MTEAIIISDIHLGSDICQSKKILNFLIDIEKENATKKLIINGDLFDSWDFRKLNKNHWKILSQIRKISKNIETIWISGNHDGPAEMVSHLLGVDFINEYCFAVGNKKILVLHGDIFDNFISKYPKLTKLADNCYRFLQKIDNSFYWSRLAKRSSKTFLRCSEQICCQAKNYARSKNYNVIICSHTHFATQNLDNDIEYYNTGCWTEKICNFISIDENIKICNY